VSRPPRSPWVRLDASYSDDPAIAGLVDPLAELLYVRGLCLASRTGSDGLVHRAQLGRILPAGATESLADDLVGAGVWGESDDPLGWRIRSWRRWQSDRSSRSPGRVGAALMTNHKRRRHESAPEPSCPLCMNGQVVVGPDGRGVGTDDDGDDRRADRRRPTNDRRSVPRSTTDPDRPKSPGRRRSPEQSRKATVARSARGGSESDATVADRADPIPVEVDAQLDASGVPRRRPRAAG
jgi:hypothetical protein